MSILNKLDAIEEANLKSAALIATILSQSGVPAAVWALCAATLYGGDLVPLDIELLVNDKDQEGAFTIPTSHGLSPSLPDHGDRPPTNFFSWREKCSSPCLYRDRRKFRHDARLSMNFRPNR